MSTTEVQPAPAVVRTDGPTRQRGGRAVVQTVFAKALIQALNAGTGILTARALLPAGRGQLAAMILWSQFLASLTSLGVPSSLIYTYRKYSSDAESGDRGSIVAAGLWLSLFTGAASAAVGALLLPRWMHQYPASVIRDAQWFLLVTPICSLTFAGKSILEAAGLFSSSNALQILTPAATLVPLIVLALMHILTPFSAALCYIIASLPPFLYLCYRLRPFITRLSFHLHACKLLLNYGMRSYGIDLLGTLAFQVDQVLVVNLLTPAAMGSYVVVLSLSRMLNVFQNSVVMVLFPKASGQPPEVVVDLTERAARVSIVITSVFAVFVYFFGPFLLNVLYGKEYGSALGSLRTLLVEVTIAGCVFVLAQAFMALGRPGMVTLLQALGLSLSVPLMLVLIPRWGIQGAALSLLASTIARFVFVYAAFRFVLKTRTPDLFPRVEDFHYLLRQFRLRRAGSLA